MVDRPASAWQRRTTGHPAHLGWGLALALLALWAWRLGTVALVDAGLHVDEAQYWDWSRQLDWGYFSKPPGIALLIRASTTLGGDSVLAIRALPALCWIGATALLWQLGRALSDSGQDPHAGAWCAALLAATPAAGLLGLVATTDAPLMLCWAAAMLATWHALRTGALVGWAAAGLAWGLGLQCKYTMAALALSWLWLAWQHPPARRGVAAALALGGLLVLPNLVWNAQHGWPTLAHTADITVAAARPAERHALASVAEFAASQLLLAGPVLWWVGWRVWRQSGWRMPWRGRQRTVTSPGGAVVPVGSAAVRPQAFAWAFVWPLLGLATTQAVVSRAQMNWTAPALLGLCLAAGLAARRLDRAGTGWRVPAAAGLLLSTAVVLAADLPTGQRLAGERPRWDLWARMRDWDRTLTDLQPALAAHPGLPVLADERELIAQAAYAWRGLGRHPQALAPTGRPAHHYELMNPWRQPATGSAPVLWLQPASTRPPPPGAVLLASSQHGRRALQLWRLPAGEPGAAGDWR